MGAGRFSAEGESGQQRAQPSNCSTWEPLPCSRTCSRKTRAGPDLRGYRWASEPPLVRAELADQALRTPIASAH